jgi:hypothetical protein
MALFYPSLTLAQRSYVMYHNERQFNRIREWTKQVSIGTKDLNRLRNASIEKQANVIPKEILAFIFLDVTSSSKEEPSFQNSE